MECAPKVDIYNIQREDYTSTIYDASSPYVANCICLLAPSRARVLFLLYGSVVAAAAMEVCGKGAIFECF